MRIKEILSSNIVEQVQTTQGVETIIELGFLAGGETKYQKIFVFQDNSDIRDKNFKLEIRDYDDSDH